MEQQPARRRVVVTGMGAVTCLGIGVEPFWRGLLAGQSGIGPMTLCDPTGYPCRIAGEVKHWDPEAYLDRKEARRMARFSQFAVAAALMAAQDARLDLDAQRRDRVGVLLGNGNGGFPNVDEAMRVLLEKGGMRISPFFIPTILPNMAAAHVSRILGLKGYNNTVVTACAASNQALGEATEVIRQGRADVMFSGGTEAGISELGLAGFAVMRALSTSNEDPQRASRPFDARRDGFVPAEGAAILVLEELEHARQRGARIYAELAGFGCSSDAFHPVQPDEDGDGAARAIRWALEDAGISPAQVDYINAHGTSTPLNDAIETLAIKRIFGDRAYQVPISSTKSMVGHSLGAAGALEAVACVQSIVHGWVHPTINYEVPDPACDLDYVPNTARQLPVRTVLSNNFGFGGQNACLVFRQLDA